MLLIKCIHLNKMHFHIYLKQLMLFARTLILIMNTLTFLIRNLHKHWTCSQECVKFLETLSMSREFKEKKKKTRETTSCNRGMHHCTQTHQRLSKPNINCLSKIQAKYLFSFQNQILTVVPKSKPNICFLSKTNISKPSISFQFKENASFSRNQI